MANRTTSPSSKFAGSAVLSVTLCWLASPASAQLVQVWQTGQLRGGQAPVTTGAPSAPGVLVPQANDSLPPTYWSDIDQLIVDMSSTTPVPQAPTAAPRPVDQVLSASARVAAPPTALSEARIEDGLASTSNAPRVNVVPWDMKLGAQVMAGIIPQNTVTPPPSQDMASAQFVAQCPMMLFSDSLYITPPRCGEAQGSWSDPSTGRSILRWGHNGKGGLYFGVDSVVTGNGSVIFADLSEKFEWQEYNFELTNCLGATRYVVNEQISRVRGTATGVNTVGRASTAGTTSQMFFYKYTISLPNGTAVAETNLFRQDQSTVNVTMIGDEVTSGPTVAVALREGNWVQGGWRSCGLGATASARNRWKLTFPMSPRDLNQVATVQDLRVAAAAVVNLMAFRDEHVSMSSGLQHVGQGYMLWSLIRTIIIIAAVLLALFIVYSVVVSYGYELKARKFCFRIEAALLPRTAMKKPLAPLHPVW